MPLSLKIGLNIGRGGGVAAPAAPNLLSNGTFDSGTTGWTLSFNVGTLTSSGGKGVVVVTSGGYVVFSTPIATTIGATYNTTADVSNSAASAFWTVWKSDSASTTTNYVQLTTGDGINQTSSFVATATTTYILLQVNSDGGTAAFDNIRVVPA